MNDFNSIIGNKHIINYLLSSYKNNKISHAYIFDAPDGMGKKLFANAFAKLIQCENGDLAPCGKCSSCLSFDSGNNPDIFYIKPSKAKGIGVDDIREQIGKNIELKPFRYKYKIFIAESADLMTVQAQNAVLKTIEEPPAYAVFILLSNNYNNFLPTILSRCVLLKIKPVDFMQVKNYLIDNVNLDSEKADIAAVYAQGNIGRALKISLSDEFVSMRNDIFDIIQFLYNNDITGVFKAAQRFENYKQNIQDALDILYMLFRDVLMLKTFDSDNYIFEKDKINVIKAISEKVTLNTLFDKIESVFNAKLQLKQNANFQMAVECMLLKLKEK